MFFDAKPNIFEKAAILRGNMTNAEKLLWKKLKDRNFEVTEGRGKLVNDYETVLIEWKIFESKYMLISHP